MTGSLSPSLVRTLVPFLVGPLVTLLGVRPDDPTVAALVAAAIGYGYYVVVRLLETFAGPRWGYVLGVAKTPGYSPAEPPAGPPAGSDAGAVSAELLAGVTVGTFLVFVLIVGFGLF